MNSNSFPFVKKLSVNECLKKKNLFFIFICLFLIKILNIIFKKSLIPSGL